jgi:hypothetical protein
MRKCGFGGVIGEDGTESTLRGGMWSRGGEAARRGLWWGSLATANPLETSANSARE